MADFLAGAITMGYHVVGVFSLRFSRRTSDRLFAIFALAFWLLAANQAPVYLIGSPQKYLSWAYLLRAAAFTLIAVAIVVKNLPERRRQIFPRYTDNSP